MTRQEATAVVQRLISWWPHVDMPAPTVALWVSKLVELNHVSAVTAVDELAGDPDIRYLPTWGQFLEAYSVTNRPRPVPWDASRALPSAPPVPSDVAKRHLADIRASLAKAKGPLARSLGQAALPAGTGLRERIAARPAQSPHLPRYDDVYAATEDAR